MQLLLPVRNGSVITSKFHKRESEVEEIYKELLKMHSENYDAPKLCLWARMIIIAILIRIWMFLLFFQLLVEALQRNHTKTLMSVLGKQCSCGCHSSNKE